MVDEVDRTGDGRVTVVIPSKDEGGWVKSTVESVLQVSGPLLQVVVVVDNGSDGSCEGLEELGHQVPVHVKKTTSGGASHARNVGAAAASGDVVVFLDAHSRPERGWLEQICGVLDMGHQGAAPAIIPFDQDERIVENGLVVGRWYLAGRPPFEVGHWPANNGDSVPLGHGACQAFRRDAFQSIGGFCAEALPFGGEDTEICLRMWSRGGTIGAAPGARVGTLTKDWGTRPDGDAILASMWTNLVKAQVLHWSAPRLTAMWAAIAEEWRDHPELFTRVWEACHDPGVLGLRRRYRAEATLSDDDLFAIFSAL